MKEAIQMLFSVLLVVGVWTADGGGRVCVDCVLFVSPPVVFRKSERGGEKRRR